MFGNLWFIFVSLVKGCTQNIKNIQCKPTNTLQSLCRELCFIENISLMKLETAMRIIQCDRETFEKKKLLLTF